MLANPVIIASIAAAPPADGIAVVAWGNTVSFLAIVLVQLPALWKLGFRWRPVFDWRDLGFRSWWVLS